MIIKQEVLCGSTKLFKNIKGFTPGDTDYILITDSDEVFEHKHPTPDVCQFIWGKDKEMVRKYLLEFPYYLLAMSLVTREFIEAYELSHDDITQCVTRYRQVYENSSYRYYVPLFDYIILNKSWEFPQEVLEKSYKIYKEYKKR